MFPNLDGEKLIALDIETHDPSIAAGTGPGARRADCYILGVGLATKDKQWYFPIAHENFNPDPLFPEHIEFAGNIPLENVAAYLKSIKNIPTAGANILYDLDYLQYHGYVPNECHDIQFAGPLLDENRDSYSLDALAQWELGEHKKQDEIAAWCKAHKLKGKPQQHLAKMPTPLVGKYCKEDCRQTIEIFLKQYPRLEAEKLIRVYDLERALIPVLLYMRKIGVRVDLKKWEILLDKYTRLECKVTKILKDTWGMTPTEKGTFTAEEIEIAFRKNDLPFEYSTETNRPIFDKAALLKTGKELGALLVEHRHIYKMLNTYLLGFQRFLIGDRLHPEFNPLRRSTEYGDEKGTGIGRFSGTNPNLQQIPRNDDEDAEQGAIIKSLFIPEEGCTWAKLDYSQMEMVIGMHFAAGEGAEKMRETYRRNPTIDSYALVASLFYGRKIEKKDKERGIFKSLTLGILYMMTADRLGRELGIITLPKKEEVVKSYWAEVMAEKNKKLPWEERMKKGWEIFDFEDYPYLEQYLEAWKFLNKINKVLPWMKATGKKAQELATKRGYVRTILGRKRRFANPNLCYKAFQAMDSGTGADIMKSAMLKAYQDGVLEILKPHITVHDELGVSKSDTKQEIEALKELKNIMETAIQLKVPLRCDVKEGPSWGECA